jgi:hypothetical protein
LLNFRSTSAATRASLSPSNWGKAHGQTSFQRGDRRLTEIHSRLFEDAQIAKAAEASATAGSIADGISVSMDIEQLIYEAGRLHDAASLLNRLSQA